MCAPLSDDHSVMPAPYKKHLTLLPTLTTSTSLNNHASKAIIAFGVFPLFLPLAITAFGASEHYFGLAVIGFGALECIVPKCYYLRKNGEEEPRQCPSGSSRELHGAQDRRNPKGDGGKGTGKKCHDNLRQTSRQFTTCHDNFRHFMTISVSLFH